MFKSFADKITSFLIVNKTIKDEEYEVYSYGFEILIAFLVNIVIVLGIGILFDKFIHTIIFLVCYCPIRQFAGGYHAENYTKCLLIFVAIFVLTIIFNNIIDLNLFKGIIIVFSILSWVGICLLAPKEHRNNPLSYKEKAHYKKVTRIMATTVLVLTIISMKFNILSEYVLYSTCALFWICVMLILATMKKDEVKIS